MEAHENSSGVAQSGTKQTPRYCNRAMERGRRQAFKEAISYRNAARSPLPLSPLRKKARFSAFPTLVTNRSSVYTCKAMKMNDMLTADESIVNHAALLAG